MATGNIFITTEPSTSAIGRTTSSMAVARRPGPIPRTTKGSTRRAKSTDQGNWSLPMAPSTKGSLIITIFMATAPMYGLTTGNTSEIGNVTKCTAMALPPGRMGGHIMESKNI